MHNKSFTVDNQIAIVGGRNIADEYFGSRDDARFGDLDVACIGPVVDEVSSSFDSYWNHERAAPIPAFAKVPEDPEAELVELRLAIDEGQGRLSKATYEGVLQDRELGLLEEDGVTWGWAPYELIVDSPDKSLAELDEDAASIKARLKQSVFAAESEAILLSPYFVPRKLGIEFLIELEARGVEVQVITNSLASNNQFAVHAGYAPARRKLLENGVELYEVRPDAFFEGQDLVAASGARSTLHTKAFILDREDVFIGSFNFDPRSANINTELGVIIHSPGMARRFADRVAEALPERTWEVFLDERDRIRWRGWDQDGQSYVLDHEPETSFWDRMAVGCLRLLPIRAQL
jgi:putative cardiolipin synthase